MEWKLVSGISIIKIKKFLLYEKYSSTHLYYK
jgi:hypothetical protein